MTRQELLLAGRKLFSEKGLYESRVEEITTRADIGKGTLYQYFRNKEGLIHAVVAAGFEELGRLVAERTARASRFEDTVAEIIDAHVDFFADNPDLMRIFHQARGMLKFKRPERRPLRQALRAHLERLARELGRASNASPLGPARRRDLAVLLFGALSGSLSVRVAVEPGAVPRLVPAGFAEALAAMALHFVSGDRRSLKVKKARRARARPGRVDRRAAS